MLILRFNWLIIRHAQHKLMALQVFLCEVNNIHKVKHKFKIICLCVIVVMNIITFNIEISRHGYQPLSRKKKIRTNEKNIKNGINT